ncbi:MAG: hypothetical protein HYZ46_04140 [Nitrosomonadales bacterium]|nr:hypothetical protein [Nitrosomonadales bacterium]
MPTFSNTSLTKFGGTIASFLIPAIIIAMFPANGQLANSPDSLFYLAVAQQIASGMGLTTPNFSLFDNNQLGAFTTWPPLFPFILASGVAPLWIQAMTLGALGAVTFLIFNFTSGRGVFLSMLAGLVCSLSMPLLVDATYVWSEILAILLIGLMVFSLSRISDSNFRRPWTMAVVFVALAIYARYAMFILVPGMMIALLLAPLSRALRIKLSLLTPLGVSLLVTPLILHNYFSSKFISGTQRMPSALDIYSNLSDAFLNTTSAFTFEVGSAWNTIFVLCLFAVVGVAIYSIKSMNQEETGVHANSSSAPSWLVRLSLVLASSYMVGMIALRTTFNFDRLDTRLMSPAVYLLDVALCAVLILIWTRFSHQKRWERLVLISPFAMLIALSIHNSIVQGAQAWKDWRATGSPYWHMNSLLVYTNIQPLSTPKIQGIVLCERPLTVKFITGWEARQIPDEPWSDSDLKRIASSSTAVLVNSPSSRKLAQRIKPLVEHSVELTVMKAQLLYWQASLHVN